MFYAKIISTTKNDILEFWIDMVGDKFENPIALTLIQLQWAIKGFIKKHEKNYSLIITTNYC